MGEGTREGNGGVGESRGGEEAGRWDPALAGPSGHIVDLKGVGEKKAGHVASPACRITRKKRATTLTQRSPLA